MALALAPPRFPPSQLIQSDASGGNVLYLLVGNQRRPIRRWDTWFALGGPGDMNAVPSTNVMPEAWLSAYQVGPDIVSPFDPSLQTAAAQLQATAPLTNNCALCATGQSSACAGCAPSTPPGFVTTGTGTPISLTSGLPLGFRPTSPVSIAGLRLPLWAWIGGGVGAWMVLRPGGRRRFL